ncbi:F-box/WD repeat-containing protein [Endozoicomonas sp. ALD040]|uniref:F-box/WD repeat-containing protein n=1 Tax=Endozoicomonas sp. ALD040 TaxID=3403079 RepID=UPI003BB04CDD
MNFIKSLSCFCGSLSSTANPSRSERASGTAKDRKIIVRNKKKPSPLLSLPEEMQSEIFTYLKAHDIAKLAQVNSYINDTLKNDTAIARAWFRRFPSSHQALLKTIVTEKNKNQLEGWLTRFTKDKALIKSVMDRQPSIYFPALFLCTLTKLMSQCKKFNLETKATFSGSGAAFSPDDHHMMIAIDNETLKIYRQEDNGSWTEKATVSHNDGVKSATFSPDGRYAITASKDGATKIYGQQADGSWVEKATISHDDCVNSATFSADGHVLTIHGNNTVQITQLKMKDTHPFSTD